MSLRIHLFAAFVGVTGLTSIGLAQPLFEEVHGGVAQYGIATLTLDSLTESLLLGGWFAYANGEGVSPGILGWDGTGFGSFGCGIAWDCVTPMQPFGVSPSRSIVRWNGDLYVGGEFFFTRHDTVYNHVMRWNGSAWLPLKSGTDGPINSLRVFPDGLYAAGIFDHADTVLARGLARWDGEEWHRVVDVPSFNIGSGSNLITDVAWFDGELYLGGNLPLVDDLAKWNGTEWVSVGGGFHSAFSRVNKMEVHGDKLYIVGAFAQCPPLGNGTDPGNGIVAWDGDQWDDLGGGTCGSTNGAVADLHWWGDTLFAVGLFNHMGGVEGDRIAKWYDGRWCTLSPPGYWNGNLIALQDYRDSLYIGGSFFEAGPDSMSNFVRWIGGSYTYACGIPEAISDGSRVQPTISVYPNPATATITLQGLPQAANTLAVHDVLGRTVLRASARPPVLDIEALPSGTYMVQVVDAQGEMQFARFVKE